jgi:hypothetical protein
MSNLPGTIVSMAPVSQRSLIFSIGMLIVQTQSILGVLQAELISDSESGGRSSEDFLAVDEISPC